MDQAEQTLRLEGKNREALSEHLLESVRHWSQATLLFSEVLTRKQHQSRVISRTVQNILENPRL